MGSVCQYLHYCRSVLLGIIGLARYPIFSASVKIFFLGSANTSTYFFPIGSRGTTVSSNRVIGNLEAASHVPHQCTKNCKTMADFIFLCSCFQAHLTPNLYYAESCIEKNTSRWFIWLGHFHCWTCPVWDRRSTVRGQPTGPCY